MIVGHQAQSIRWFQVFSCSVCRPLKPQVSLTFQQLKFYYSKMGSKNSPPPLDGVDLAVELLEPYATRHASPA